jgi:serine/threonine protein kinase
VAVVYGVEQWRGTPLLVMEYLGGGTLLQRLRRGRLEDGEAASLVLQLARSLARVHGRGLYHGDIKPSNIGFAPGGAPKLLDFGLARALLLDSSNGHELDGRARPPWAARGRTWPPSCAMGRSPGRVWTCGRSASSSARRGLASIRFRMHAPRTTWPLASWRPGPACGPSVRRPTSA